ncbi:hypothetical protein KCP77_02590 [Salmonella enterica subsp. enterica]|nr:hypothetical protein KCP77_02590 [Salmonella enterica subsp. enterica]
MDNCIDEVTKAVESVGGQLLITADHGSDAERMRDPATGQAHTAHTNLPVPLIYVGEKNVKTRSKAAAFGLCACTVADGDGNPARDDW